MDAHKVFEVVDRYRKYFEERRIGKSNFPHDRISGNEKEILEHCHGMLDQMEEFVKKGEMGKVFRWLGFIQGCLWSLGDFTLEDFKAHNRTENSGQNNQAGN